MGGKRRTVDVQYRMSPREYRVVQALERATLLTFHADFRQANPTLTMRALALSCGMDEVSFLDLFNRALATRVAALRRGKR